MKWQYVSGNFSAELLADDQGVVLTYEDFTNSVGL